MLFIVYGMPEQMSRLWQSAMLCMLSESWGVLMDFGLIVDVETTGLDAASDRIIEIGLLEFAVLPNRQPALIRCYGALEDPGIPLSSEIIALTGIDEVAIKGAKIDWATVRSMFARAGIVIAHNAAFDRAFLEASGYLEGLKPHWACSLRHIDWRKQGKNSLALNYLAADHGFVNPFAHRAVFDVATTFRLIVPHLEELVRRSYEREILVRAEGSPFESKDLLKARGYRWCTKTRCWSRIVAESEIEDERNFLQSQIYRGHSHHTESIQV